MYTEVKHFKGGISGWQAAKAPVAGARTGALDPRVIGPPLLKAE